jgi:hypothetical protein
MLILDIGADVPNSQLSGPESARILGKDLYIMAKLC